MSTCISKQIKIRKEKKNIRIEFTLWDHFRVQRKEVKDVSTMAFLGVGEITHLVYHQSIDWFVRPQSSKAGHFCHRP